jgi:hypothetical protein
MTSTGSRFCDVCGETIDPGETYRSAELGAEAAAFLLEARDPDLVPTWTQLANGNVRIDICAVCMVSMGPSIRSDPH